MEVISPPLSFLYGFDLREWKRLNMLPRPSKGAKGFLRILKWQLGSDVDWDPFGLRRGKDEVESYRERNANELLI